MRTSAILGLNARSRLYLQRYNSREARRIADSKLRTKKVLKLSEISIPEIYGKFKKVGDINAFDWEGLPGSFALKPNRGLGGEGIIVVKKRLEKDAWLTTQKTRVTIEDLKLHVQDILEGAFSIDSSPDIAYIEEYVGRHKAFRKYAFRGTPDIRVIVFNKVPVMAMLRLPTRESGGRANLHQGAVGVGIDIATGITTTSVWHGDYIKYKPETERKLNGIKIPSWTRILETAVRCQIATELGYLGADIVLHPERGPMILELNARPGLQIQLANRAGLKKRLERVEDLNVRDAEHGVNIAKAIFAERFADRVKAEEGIKTINVWEEIKIVAGSKKKVRVYAKIDTGAWRTSIDKDLAKRLGLLKEENILWTRKVRTAIGREERYVINLTYWLAGRRIATIASISNRSHLRTPVIIGRRDLDGFLVAPSFRDKPVTWVPPMWKGRIDEKDSDIS